MQEQDQAGLVLGLARICTKSASAALLFEIKLLTTAIAGGAVCILCKTASLVENYSVFLPKTPQVPAGRRLLES